MMCCGVANAQSDDPVIMRINGVPVNRSEFEYSYNKNNSEGVIDRKTVEEYVPMFINYKLKVLAAEKERIDTTKSFLNEFASYRDQQIRPTIINDEDVELEAHKIYKQTQERIDGNGGLFNTSHILLMLKQKAPKEEQEIQKKRIDSIYTALKKGANFEELARKFSQDKGTAVNGGKIGMIAKGQTLKEFEDVMMSMKTGEISKPFLSPAGYHIIKLNGKQNFFPYDSMRTSIMQFIEQRGLREKIIDQKLESLAKQRGNGTTVADVLAIKQAELEQNDPDMKYLIQEYHDGLLLYEVMNKNVWGRVASDTLGLEQYFKKNKKKYKWESPRFKGIAYYTRSESDVDAVKKAIKKVDFDKWAPKLRSEFNSDSVLRIRVEKGIFKLGDNALVDRLVFKKDTVEAKKDGFPYTAVFGKVLKSPKEANDVRGLVVADYQDKLEADWVEQLRRTYPVVVDEKVLATVNKH